MRYMNAINHKAADIVDMERAVKQLEVRAVLPGGLVSLLPLAV